MKRTKTKRILKNQQSKPDFETTYTLASLKQDKKYVIIFRDNVVLEASLKQRTIKKIIDAYPLVGTGGGGNIKQNYYKQKMNM